MSRRPDQLQHPPIGLHAQMRKLRLSAAHIARSIDVRHTRLGHRVSPTSIQYLARNGLFPVSYDPEALRSQIEIVIAQAGGDVTQLWEPEAATSGPTSESLRAPRADAGAPDNTFSIPEPEMLSEAAKKQFRLLRHPFSNELVSGQDVYFSADARYVREAMYYAAKHCGLLAVIAESGGGKSVLRRDLIERLGRSDERVAVIQASVLDKTFVSSLHLLHAILADISLEAPKRSLEALSRQVKAALKTGSHAGHGHVLLIEEAHKLSTHTLKVLKELWEFEDGFRKLIGIILIGQTELRDKLDEQRNPQAREFIRRCEIATLRPLGADVAEYVAFKLSRVMALGSKIDDIFDRDALDAIRPRLTRTRQGQRLPDDLTYPQNVNNIVVNALNAAADLGYPKVTADIIKGV